MATPPWKAFAIIAGAYALALLAAVGSTIVVPVSHPLLQIAFGTVVATAVVFAFSRFFDNTSVYDPYWSVAPMVAVIYLFAGPGSGNARSIIVIALVALWSWRLTLNWARSWRGLAHEDWRYLDIRNVTGGAYWWASAFGLHLFPTIIVFLGLLPAHAAITNPKAFGALDGFAAFVTVAGIACETIADEQLKRFRERPSAAVCSIGLWRYSRHPNYFGEITFWVGIWLFGLAAGAPWWTVLGPVAMVTLFLSTSIPLMERHLSTRRAGWAEHRARTSMLIPWPPRPES